MCNTPQMVDMGFTQEKFLAGTHMCLIYGSEKERQSIIAKFITKGLLTHEKVAYFADELSESELLSWLENVGITDSGSYLENKTLSISSAEKTYCPHGSFVPEDVFTNLKNFSSQFKAEGYLCGRVSGEMTWALRGIPGSNRLMEYEALVNDVLITHRITAICQYDANRFDGATILNCLKVHPFMVVHGQIVHNPYYIKSEEFLKESLL